ncbi:MFS transporter [Arthrobacter sp. B2a2-09]|uniref:MFS transporter n=1 Tax=Arthrobacter sp. B2a2-09 TaxID=2952822 RepID=UPI0022CD7AAA|nr:MFS transporter [Arthrobacter sp. B2a2-09]MCZ9883615.1 MFS transporter [Arthrobacter sp. B2a2-09]
MSTPTLVARPPAKEARRALVAGSVGNFIEWYEFGIYGSFATIISTDFFTTAGASDFEALIKTYASFAIAFFFRPVGAAIFGRIGDRIGRRPTLIIVLLLMTGSTALIGVLPNYATLGVMAPILLTLVRILQGLSAGGEFGGAVSIMTEFAPTGKRGSYGSWQSFTVGLGLLAGAGVGALMASLLTAKDLSDWGWRIPFLLALPLGLVALYLRLKLEETPNFQRTVTAETGQAPGVVLQHPSKAETARAILLGIGRLMGWSAAGYTFLVVLPSYLQTSLHATFQAALIATVLANAGFAASIIPSGILSDRWGRRPIMLAGAILITVLAIPLLKILQDPTSPPWLMGAGVFIAGAVVGMMAGPGPAMLSEMFPTTVRYTGLGLSYSIANAVFSGSAGLIITALIASTGNKDIPAYYVMATCIISVFALATLRGSAHKTALRD